MLTTRRLNLRRTDARFGAALGLVLLSSGSLLAAEPEGPATLPPPPTVPAEAPAEASKPAAEADKPAADPTKPAAPAAPTQAATPALPSAGSLPPEAAAAPSAAGAGQPLGDLDRRIGELKDQVFRAKARLSLLSETTLSTSAGSARAVVVHKHKLGPLYRPVRLSYQLDGRDIFSRSDETGALAKELGKDLTVWEGGLKPGDHVLGITVVFRGNGAKVFSYYDQYTFTTRAAHRFTAVDGQTSRVQVVCFEKGNPLLTSVEQRPTCELKPEDPARPGGTPAAAPAAATPASPAPAAATPAPAAADKAK